MNEEVTDNTQVQPIADIMTKHNFTPHDLVAAVNQQLTHKMVSRACKGKKLTMKSKLKILKAMNAATEKEYSLSDLFND